MRTFNQYLEETKEEGVVEEIVHSIAHISGLPGVCLSEVVMFETGQKGQVMALKPDHAEVLLLSRQALQVGTRAARTGFPLQINVSLKSLGQVIDPMGNIIEGQALTEGELRPVDLTPLGISSRKKITRTLETGVILVDLMVPLGMGQRELILGDRKTGKSYIARQALVNQARQGNIGVYAAIGKKKSEIKMIIEYFRRHKVLDKVAVVASSSHDAVGEVYITPFTAMSMAEYFRDTGRDVLVVLDDMTTHAKFYRELSLLARKFPGRDSYPGDVFHVHSKIVERAGNFEKGSITCLPIADIVSGDMTGFIQTNLMSMTDGHILFDGELYAAGRRPAINPFLSVTRVGHQTQDQLRRDINQKLFDLLNDYERTQSFLRFGAELGENSRQTLAMGEKLIAFFNQPLNTAVPIPVQVVLLGLLWTGSWDGKNLIKAVEIYQTDANWKSQFDKLASEAKEFKQLVDNVRAQSEALLKLLQ